MHQIFGLMDTFLGACIRGIGRHGDRKHIVSLEHCLLYESFLFQCVSLSQHCAIVSGKYITIKRASKTFSFIGRCERNISIRLDHDKPQQTDISTSRDGIICEGKGMILK